MTGIAEAILLIRSLMELKALADEVIGQQAQRAGLSQAELDRIFEESKAKVLARDPDLIPDL